MDYNQKSNQEAAHHINSQGTYGDGQQVDPGIQFTDKEAGHTSHKSS